jgi:hypothetical protein
MTRLEDRQILMRDIAQARAEGSRLAPACALAGLDPRTLQRWKTGDGLSVSDRRPDADRPVPSHALSEAEQARIIAVANRRAATDRLGSNQEPSVEHAAAVLGWTAQRHPMCQYRVEQPTQ